MGEINTILVGWLVREGRALGVVQQLVDNRLEGEKLSYEFGLHGMKFLLGVGL
jgi:hypothetical protein